jgi:hypothetical protein
MTRSEFHYRSTTYRIRNVLWHHVARTDCGLDFAGASSGATTFGNRDHGRTGTVATSFDHDDLKLEFSNRVERLTALNLRSCCPDRRSAAKERRRRGQRDASHAARSIPVEARFTRRAGAVGRDRGGIRRDRQARAVRGSDQVASGLFCASAASAHPLIRAESRSSAGSLSVSETGGIARCSRWRMKTVH